MSRSHFLHILLGCAQLIKNCQCIFVLLDTVSKCGLVEVGRNFVEQNLLDKDQGTARNQRSENLDKDWIQLVSSSPEGRIRQEGEGPNRPAGSQKPFKILLGGHKDLPAGNLGIKYE